MTLHDVGARRVQRSRAATRAEAERQRKMLREKATTTPADPPRIVNGLQSFVLFHVLGVWVRGGEASGISLKFTRICSLYVHLFRV